MKVRYGLSALLVLALPLIGQQGDLHRFEQLGQQVIDRVDVAGGRHSMIWPAASQISNDQLLTAVTETWVSAGLKLTMLTKSADPRHGETTRRRTDISHAEPDEGLFVLPESYVVQP